ncbi:MAG: site-2 protease family protein [Candidatus Binatia bacterium]
MSDPIEFLIRAAVIAPPILLAVVLHEIAHGYVAYRLGDDTAKLAGRLTLNPLSHLDPVGSVILPMMLALGGLPPFGWAKPVPVNFLNLPNPKRDMIKVAIAGPATNVVLALLSAALVHLARAQGWPVLHGVATISVYMNVTLALLNMVPILPLDGGRVLFGLLPREPARAFARTERYGMVIVMLLLFSGVLTRVLRPLSQLVIDQLGI